MICRGNATEGLESRNDAVQDQRWVANAGLRPRNLLPQQWEESPQPLASLHPPSQEEIAVLKMLLMEKVH